MKGKIKIEKACCFICEVEVVVDVKGFFLGVKDNLFHSRPLCKNCSKIWDKHIELLNDDKSNFYNYEDIIRNYVKNDVQAHKASLREMIMESKIIHGDCLEIMKDIEDDSVNLILCDLPYGTTACSWDTIIPLDELWEAYYRILRPNGFIILTGSQPFTTKLINSNIDNFSHQWIWKKNTLGNPLLANVQPMKNFEDVIVFSNEFAKHDNTGKNPVREYLINEKKKSGLTNKDFNKMFSDYTNKEGCRDRSVIEHYWGKAQFTFPTKEIYENILQKTGFFEKPYSFIQELGKPYREMINKELNLTYPRVYNPQKVKGNSYVQRQGSLGEAFGGTIKENIVTKNEGNRFPTSIIKFNMDKEKLHPTQKPVALFEYLIKTYTNEGELVLDNCIGSGTTAIACIRTGRKFIGIEKEEKYVEITNKRINDALVENHG